MAADLSRAGHLGVVRGVDSCHEVHELVPQDAGQAETLVVVGDDGLDVVVRVGGVHLLKERFVRTRIIPISHLTKADFRNVVR